MQVTPQLMRIIKEEIESLDYGKITITVNVSGPYTEISSEKRTRVAKNEEKYVDNPLYHKG